MPPHAESPREAPPPGARVLGGRRLVLTVTTGRSGTKLLARALALFPGVDARHEPKPRFSSAMRTVLAAPATAREFWLEHKLPALARRRARVLVETSHFACKGFLEAALELGLAPTLVHLRRPPRAVALSLLAMGTIPGRSYRGVKHYLSPADPNDLPLTAGAAEGLTDYQLCLWYALEGEARARRLRTLWEARGLAFHTVDLAELVAPGGIAELGRRLELSPLTALGRWRAGRLVLRRVNQQPGKKREVALTDDALARQEEELELLSSTRSPDGAGGPPRDAAC